MRSKRSLDYAELRSTLFAATDGRVACKALNAIAESASSGQSTPLDLLSEYAERGPIAHMRDHAASLLVDVCPAHDPRFGLLFERLLLDAQTRYWAINGLARVQGEQAFPKLCALAFDSGVPLGHRANAVKNLAAISGQRFDRQLPSDPGHWKESDLRLDEVRAWASSGFPKGTGFAPPLRSPALDRATTPLEKLAAGLDLKLAAARGLEDPANPHNRLVAASERNMAAILAKWKLPAMYRDFLTRFSPLRVLIENKRFYNGGLSLFGASELLPAQVGYAHDPSGRPLAGWPKGYLVIAAHAGDPFVLDLARASREEAPVYTADHGTGTWSFVNEAPSFLQFLAKL